MKAGTENRKKTIIAAALGTVGLICVFYIYTQLFGGSTPAPAPAPVVVTTPKPATPTQTTIGTAPKIAAVPTGNAAGVAATKLASASTSLDPTLDQSAMLRTEHLVYSGSGRNIFSAVYTPPVVIPKAVAPIRPKPCPPNCPPPQPPPVVIPPPTCPPSCPPINLKFFGTATRPNGVRQAFLLQGEDVFLASAGDIVARRFKIVSISATSIQVEDLTNTNTQSLPLQSN